MSVLWDMLMHHLPDSDADAYMLAYGLKHVVSQRSLLYCSQAADLTSAVASLILPRA